MSIKIKISVLDKHYEISHEEIPRNCKNVRINIKIPIIRAEGKNGNSGEVRENKLTCDINTVMENKEKKILRRERKNNNDHNFINEDFKLDELFREEIRVPILHEMIPQNSHDKLVVFDYRDKNREPFDIISYMHNHPNWKLVKNDEERKIFLMYNTVVTMLDHILLETLNSSNIQRSSIASDLLLVFSRYLLKFIRIIPDELFVQLLEIIFLTSGDVNFALWTRHKKLIVILEFIRNGEAHFLNDPYNVKNCKCERCII